MYLPKSLAIIIGSTLLISGTTAFILHRYRTKLKNRLANPDYFISLIIQTGSEKNALPTSYLAELMELSFDKPTNLYAFSAKAAEKKLLCSPLIQSAHVKPIKPSAVYVEYKVRAPILTLAEYPNTGIDATGHLFPIEPYLTPKNLPELILGRPISLHDQLDMTLINDLLTHTTNIKRIDLTDLEATSAGRRQIVVVIDSHTLRLSTKHYRQELNRYLQLCSKFKNDEPKIIDFRIDDMAFIDND